jgi:hypothetical protein
MDDFTSNSCGMSTHCCATDTQSAPMTTVTGTEDFTTNSSGMPTHFWEADAQSAPMTAATGTDDSATNPFSGLPNQFWPHNMFAPYSATDTQPAPPAATAADAREPLSSRGSRFGGQHGTTMAASQQAAVAARREAAAVRAEAKRLRTRLADLEQRAAAAEHRAQAATLQAQASAAAHFRNALRGRTFVLVRRQLTMVDSSTVSAARDHHTDSFAPYPEASQASSTVIGIPVDQPHHPPSVYVATPYGPTRRVCMCPPRHCLVLAVALLLNMVFWTAVIVLVLGLEGQLGVDNKVALCAPTGFVVVAAYMAHWYVVLTGPLKDLADRGVISACIYHDGGIISAGVYYFTAFVCLDGIYGVCCIS